jgi:hypothetical protein
LAAFLFVRRVAKDTKDAKETHTTSREGRKGRKGRKEINNREQERKDNAKSGARERQREFGWGV